MQRRRLQPKLLRPAARLLPCVATSARRAMLLAMFEAAERALGPITGLVNSAGVSINTRVDAINAARSRTHVRRQCDRPSALLPRSSQAHVDTPRRQGRLYRQCLLDGGDHRRASRCVGLRGQQGCRRRVHHGFAKEVAAEGSARQRGAPGRDRHRHDRAHAARRARARPSRRRSRCSATAIRPRWRKRSSGCCRTRHPTSPARTSMSEAAVSMSAHQSDELHSRASLDGRSVFGWEKDMRKTIKAG